MAELGAEDLRREEERYIQKLIAQTTTADIRRVYVSVTGQGGGYQDISEREFDAWLERVKRDARDAALREAIQMANETSDRLGNLYRIDYINRLEHEIELMEGTA